MARRAKVLRLGKYVNLSTKTWKVPKKHSANCSTKLFMTVAGHAPSQPMFCIIVLARKFTLERIGFRETAANSTNIATFKLCCSNTLTPSTPQQNSVQCQMTQPASGKPKSKKRHLEARAIPTRYSPREHAGTLRLTRQPTDQMPDEGSDLDSSTETLSENDERMNAIAEEERQVGHSQVSAPPSENSAPPPHHSVNHQVTNHEHRNFRETRDEFVDYGDEEDMDHEAGPRKRNRRVWNLENAAAPRREINTPLGEVQAPPPGPDTSKLTGENAEVARILLEAIATANAQTTSRLEEKLEKVAESHGKLQKELTSQKTKVTRLDSEVETLKKQMTEMKRQLQDGGAGANATYERRLRAVEDHLAREEHARRSKSVVFLRVPTSNPVEYVREILHRASFSDTDLDEIYAIGTDPTSMRPIRALFLRHSDKEEFIGMTKEVEFRTCYPGIDVRNDETLLYRIAMSRMHAACGAMKTDSTIRVDVRSHRVYINDHKYEALDFLDEELHSRERAQVYNINQLCDNNGDYERAQQMKSVFRSRPVHGYVRKQNPAIVDQQQRRQPTQGPTRTREPTNPQAHIHPTGTFATRGGLTAFGGPSNRVNTGRRNQYESSSAPRNPYDRRLQGDGCGRRF